MSPEEIEAKVRDLEARIIALEGHSHITPHPWLQNLVCMRCRLPYKGQGYIVCGATPLCPHCGGTQMPWEQK